MSQDAQSPAERQRAFRARKAIAPTLTINLTAKEADLYDRCFDQQRTDSNTTQFAKNALLTGAKFRTNSGTPTKEKIS